MSHASVSHPLFARFYARVLSRAEPAEVTEHRHELLRGLQGRVVEVGAGAGANFAHYPAAVTEVVAVEPEPYLRERAQEAAARAEVAVTVLDGLADALPVADGSCDAAVACLVLCTVPDQRSALTELWRVLAPGGTLRFYEHVRAQEPRTARYQERVDRLFWPKLFGGCHTARATGAAIADAGFEFDRRRTFELTSAPRVLPVRTHTIGSAHKPAAAPASA